MDGNGALPMHVGPIPAAVSDLLGQVKEYERLTVAAALAGPAIPPDSDNGVPAFDIARIEPTGEAVIADRAQQWNCYATASCMNARSRINPDNSLWSRPDFPQALTI